MFRNGWPKNRNMIMRPPDIKVAFRALMLPKLVLRDTSRGTDPMISITANSVKVTVSNSLNDICIPSIYANIRS